jgi:phosphoribosylaminoimidazolecarboxamide formyltransferase/IMP cyclohydrolase
MAVKRALLSVSDKGGLETLARGLAEMGVELWSTGGTARVLREAGLAVRDVSELTGFPEMMEGRVKTLHPKVHGGLLYVRGNAEHEAQAREHGIVAIDLVVVNLYPFEATVRREGVTLEEAIENIDIGGPSMLRSAAKNHASVTVLCDPADYAGVLEELRRDGDTALATRRRLAAKVYAHTGRYDALIAQYLEGVAGGGTEVLPAELTLPLTRGMMLRYGENPHQKAAFYGRFEDHFAQRHGKELSFNNLVDLNAAVQLIAEFEEPTVAILKHNNPCGVGSAPVLADAWDRAFATDRQAPFGGVIAVNRPVDAGLAGRIQEIFSEVVTAPEFTDEAMAVLTAKKNLRLVTWRNCRADQPGRDVRSVIGGVLVQERDAAGVDMGSWRVVTKRAPSAAERAAMAFGWRVVKHVKSNAIVYCGPDRTLGVGAGQMSRVDSSKLAVWKAGEAGLDLRGSVVASDAFFPFADGVVAAAEAGATAFIQPGGSVRDAEVIAACDERGLAMVFTGVRHFRH